MLLMYICENVKCNNMSKWHDANQNEYEILQKENVELKQFVFQLESKLFLKMDSYRLVEQKSRTKCLSPTEKKQIFADIRYVFILSIKILREACSNLTEEDIMFCCLAKLNLENRRLCHCMGSASRQATNQRKYRIKKKMKESSCENLFDMIFTGTIEKS